MLADCFTDEDISRQNVLFREISGVKDHCRKGDFEWVIGQVDGC